MSAIIILIVIYYFLRRWMSRDSRRSDFVKWFFIIYVAAAVVQAILPGLGSVIVLAAVIWFFYKMYKQKKQQPGDRSVPGSDAYRRASDQYRSQREREQRAEKKTSRSREKTILPEAARKREKIVRTFNEKYDLALTREQIEQIVNASYMSEIWRWEVEAMSKKYGSVYEWFQGETKHLRVYMYVFRVQEISSDIAVQEMIIENAFEQVFRYADSLTTLTMDERIRRVNDTYFTQFDNATFMIAYRYLESRGRKHTLAVSDPIRSDDDLEQLKRKYQDSI